MGYQDGFGLRPGRTKDKVSADRGSNDSTFSAAAGYRAAGAVTPQRGASNSDGLSSGQGQSALAQFSSDTPKMNVPKTPGLLETVGTAVATKAAGSALEKGVSKIADSRAGKYASHMISGSDIPFSAIESANATEDPIYALGDSQGWFDGATGGAEYAVPGIGTDGYIDVMGDGVGAATELTSSGIPYFSAGLKALQGNLGGAAGSVGGALIGNMILPGIGGVIGGALGGAIGGGCFITEATMAGLGVQDDNAEPLKVLRFFRDKVLAGTPQGQAMIQEYEAIAPLVVQAVESRPDAMEIFKALYEQFIAPAVEAVKGGDYPQALQIYAAMIAAVTPYAQEAMDAEDMGEGEMEQASEGPESAMEDMGQHAGMVAQSPGMAQQAAPQGALQQFNAEDDYPSSVRFGRR